MKRSSLLSLLPALLLLGCPTVADDDDATEPIPEHPEVVNNEWIDDLVGTIAYTKNYTSGDLEGTSCVETFNVTGSPLSQTPEQCLSCDVVYQVFVSVADDCPGGDDLEEQGQAGFDLRQTETEAVMWWFQEGWFGDDWTELGTGDLTQDFETSVLDFVMEFDDPNNGSFGGNNVWDFGAGCAPCSYEGFYVMDFDFAFDLPADWYEQQQAAE